MSRTEWIALGFFMLAAMILAGAFGYIMGCAPTQPQPRAETLAVSQDAIACRARISRIIQAPDLTCPEQVAKIKALGHEDPACLEVYVGRDIDLTCKDGGRK